MATKRNFFFYCLIAPWNFYLQTTGAEDASSRRRSHERRIGLTPIGQASSMPKKPQRTALAGSPRSNPTGRSTLIFNAIIERASRAFVVASIGNSMGPLGLPMAPSLALKGVKERRPSAAFFVICPLKSQQNSRARRSPS
jgi:hypothetical protein